MPDKKGFYTVKNGDSWARIAGNTTGDQRNFLRIAQANGGYLKPGMVIRIPGSVHNGPASISNSQAAAVGLATTDQLKQAYNDNGTGGYNSARLPMGGMNDNFTPPGAVAPGVAGSGASSPAQSNVSMPLAAQQWQMANPNKPPNYTVPQTGQSAANAWQQANKPQQSPAIGDSGFVDLGASATSSPNTQGAHAPGNTAQVGTPGSPLLTYNGSNIPTQTQMSATQSFMGTKTTLNPGEVASKTQDMYNTGKPGTGTVAASPTGQSQPLPQFTPTQVKAAEDKIAIGQATMTDYKIKEASLLAQGISAEDIKKNFEQYHPDLARKIFTQGPPASTTDTPTSLPDTATGGWNNPTGPGYTSPSGYFVPYIRKTDDGKGKGIYDYKTGKYHPHYNGDDPNTGRLVPGIESSNLTTGLVTWRY